MAPAHDRVRITVPAIEVIAGLTEKRRRASKNGPVMSRNHREALSPSMRDYVLVRCERRGVSVTAVLVVSPDEVIIP